MELTERELRLIMLALDNTSVMLQDEATAAGNDEVQQEAEDMDALYTKIMHEITILEGSYA